MARLPGNEYVHWKGEEYAPGSAIPDDLAKVLNAAPGDADDDSGESGASGDGGFDVEKATVPELRAELDRLKSAGAEGTDYSSDDRKDALQAKVREAQAR